MLELRSYMRPWFAELRTGAYSIQVSNQQGVKEMKSIKTIFGGKQISYLAMDFLIVLSCVLISLTFSLASALPGPTLLSQAVTLTLASLAMAHLYYFYNEMKLKKVAAKK